MNARQSIARTLLSWLTSGGLFSLVLLHAGVDACEAERTGEPNATALQDSWNGTLVAGHGHLPQEVAAESQEAFVSMFDGKTLDGWSPSSPRAAHSWYVEDGIIVGKGDEQPSYLIYDRNRNIADFEMKFSYRFPGEGNSGVSIRVREDVTGRRDYQAYHVDLGHVGIGKQILGAWDFHTPGRREHRCFRGERLVIDKNDQPTLSPIPGAVTEDDIRQHAWNEVHIIAKGNHFRFFINDKPASQFTEHLPSERRLKSGMIQLQLHDPGMVVHFKDLRIKVLDD